MGFSFAMRPCRPAMIIMGDKNVKEEDVWIVVEHDFLRMGYK